MPAQAMSSHMTALMSMGMVMQTQNVVITNTAVASLTDVQVVTETAAATAVATVGADAAATVDCSGAISSALAAAGLGGADAATATSPALFPNATAIETAAATSTGSVTPPPASGGSVSVEIDLGSCPNPTIIFADGLDGRKEPSFAPADETTFTHGSALNIKVITDFICQQLEVKCKASSVTITQCQSGATAAQGQKGQAAADAFNAALGM